MPHNEEEMRNSVFTKQPVVMKETVNVQPIQHKSLKHYMSEAREQYRTVMETKWVISLLWAIFLISIAATIFSTHYRVRKIYKMLQQKL